MLSGYQLLSLRNLKQFCGSKKSRGQSSSQQRFPKLAIQFAKLNLIYIDKLKVEMLLKPNKENQNNSNALEWSVTLTLLGPQPGLAGLHNRL